MILKKRKKKERNLVKPCKGTAVFHPSDQLLDGNLDHFLGTDKIGHQDPILQQFP